jgi:hypothetical protein
MKDENVMTQIESFNERRRAFILPPSSFILAFSAIRRRARREPSKRGRYIFYP